MTYMERLAARPRISVLASGMAILRALASIFRRRTGDTGAGNRRHCFVNVEAARDLELRRQNRDYAPSTDRETGSEARLHRIAESIRWRLPR